VAGDLAGMLAGRDLPCLAAGGASVEPRCSQEHNHHHAPYLQSFTPVLPLLSYIAPTTHLIPSMSDVIDNTVSRLLFIEKGRAGPGFVYTNEGS
jgi:hypothetical protein